MGNFFENIVKAAGEDGKLGDIINVATQGGSIGDIVNAATGNESLGDIIDSVKNLKGKKEDVEEEVIDEEAVEEEEVVEEEVECEEPVEEETEGEEAQEKGGFGAILGSILQGDNLGKLAKGVISIIGLAGGAAK